MPAIFRRSFVLAFCVAAALMITGNARAQITCDECDPYNNHCSDECWYCQGDYPDYCPAERTHYSTCGDYAGACTLDNCTPDWQLTSQTNVGTYGQEDYGWYWNGWELWPRFRCEHHRVDSVTYHDANECNMNSAYWDRSDCIDYADYISGWSDDYQYCCSYVLGLECNDWHSCS